MLGKQPLPGSEPIFSIPPDAMPPVPCFLILLLHLLFLHHASAQTFTDVSLEVGIDHSMGPRTKYGGPTVVDLNSDGYPDLIFCHHGKHPVEVYISTGDGKFTKHPFRFFSDNHGVVAFRHSSFTRNMRFAICPGGGAGTRPTNPRMYEYRFKNGSIVEVTEASGIDAFGGRGRTALYLPLRRGVQYRPDAVFTNARVIPGFEPQQYGYRNLGRGKFKLQRLKGFANTANNYITVADVDNDGRMEIVAYKDLKVYKITGPFTFVDITADVLPTGIDLEGVEAIAEFDYDGDGDMDLYVSRTNTGASRYIRRETFDYMFENRDGIFFDVSEEAKIPQDSTTRAVTAADFNNDGWMDLFLTRYEKSDLLLLNNGDGTFRTVPGLIPRPSNARGDSAQAVDYDSDGRVDLIVGQGDRALLELGGMYRVFKNQLNLTRRRRYILVRVGNAPGRLATSLHALVTVTGSGGFKAVRRVGSPGTAVSSSYIELIHVGIGKRSRVNVIVRWTNGVTFVQRNVTFNSKIVVGEV